MNKLLLLGAGASFGSDNANIPPLGSQLFDALCIFNPDAWGSLPTDFPAKFRNDFEAAMTELGNTHPHSLPPLQRAMAAYFFEFIPRQSNLYLNLANRMKSSNWNGAICTLNYERLLEISLSSVGLQPTVGSETKAGTSIELCLPHGCCHIFCDSVHGTSQGVSFSGFGVTTDGQVIVVSDPTEHRNRIINDAFPPVMSYFEPNKRTTSGASFISSQRARWSELVNQADVIVAIAIKLRVDDSHIWDPIQQCSADLYYCSGNSSGEEFLEWAENTRSNFQNYMFPGYLSTEFSNICQALGL